MAKTLDYYNKYQKYKQKYLNFKDMNVAYTDIKYDNIQYGGKDDILLSISQLYEIYGNTYRIYDLYNKHRKTFNVLINYIYSRFGPFSKRINANSVFTNNKSDAKFFEELRKCYTDNIDRINDFRKKIYRGDEITEKVNSINTILKSDPNFKCRKILDIGTEDVKYLNGLEKVTGCKAIGLNIEAGYSHYNTYDEAIASGLIVLYDGKDIPFKDNEFDLVTIITVLHHVQNVEHLIDEICRVSKTIYIRDNDMINVTTANIVDIQHELYEGILYPGERSPLYIITHDEIVRLLKKNGFEIIYDEIRKYFSRAFILLATKK